MPGVRELTWGALLAAVMCGATARGGEPLPPGYEAVPQRVYGFGVPSSRWGWYGVHYRGRVLLHRGFYGDRAQWTYRRGY
jgi:hypothetical protein